MTKCCYFPSVWTIPPALIVQSIVFVIFSLLQLTNTGTQPSKCILPLRNEVSMFSASMTAPADNSAQSNSKAIKPQNYVSRHEYLRYCYFQDKNLLKNKCISRSCSSSVKQDSNNAPQILHLRGGYMQDENLLEDKFSPRELAELHYNIGKDPAAIASR